MLHCSIELQDEVNIRIRGLSPGTLSKVVNRLTFTVKNFVFMKAYKMGRWDGKIRLCGPTGKTYFNLLEYVMPVIEKDGYSVRIVDNRRPFDASEVPIIDSTFLSAYEHDGKPIVLEQHQVDGVNAVTTSGGGLVIVGTGGGKTFLSAALTKLYSPLGKVVMIVPEIALMLQTQHNFNKVGIDAGLFYGDIKDPKHVTLSTWQSLDHHPEIFADVRTVINDECHGADAKVLHSVLTGPAKNVPIRIGMTGSMPEEDLPRYQIIAALGPPVFEKPAWELQRDGFLADCDITMWQFDDHAYPNYQAASHDHAQFIDECQWQAVDQFRRLAMVEMIREISKSGNTLVLLEYKKVGYALESEFPGSIFVSGDIQGKKRLDIYREINANDDRLVFATYKVASTGIDIPRLFNLVLIEPGVAVLRVIQSIGRGLRRANDKDHINIHDFGSTARFGRNHFKTRQAIYRSAKYPFQVKEVNYW